MLGLSSNIGVNDLAKKILKQLLENNHIDLGEGALDHQLITEEEKEDLSALTEALLRLKNQLNDVVGES